MNRIIVGVFALTLLLTASAFKFLEVQTPKGLQSLAISEAALKSSVWNSLSNSYLQNPSPSKFKQLVTGNRAAMVRDIVVFAKSYVGSEEFNKKYLEYRESKKPKVPEKPKSMQTQRLEQLARMQKSLKESEENFKKAPADQKLIFKGIVDMMREQVKQLEDPNNPMYNKEMDDMLQDAYTSGLEIHRQQMLKWEEEYPIHPAPMVRKWLGEFLEATQDIDFNAELKTNKHGMKEFVNPAYEGKSSQWKLCFRAGKEAVDAGRAEAKKWFTELSVPN